MFNKAKKVAEKAVANLDIIELEAEEAKALAKHREAGNAVAKAKAWVEVTKVREKLRDARLVVKPRKGRPGNGTKRKKKGGGGFFGALLGDGA